MNPLITCPVCQLAVDRLGTYTHMACGHHAHVHCAATLLKVSLWRCLVCERAMPPQLMPHTLVAGTNAAAIERLANEMRVARRTQVRARARARTLSLSFCTGCLIDQR